MNQFDKQKYYNNSLCLDIERHSEYANINSISVFVKDMLENKNINKANCFK